MINIVKYVKNVGRLSQYALAVKEILGILIGFLDIVGMVVDI